MILDDGGDLANMVIDRYPELVAGIKVYLKKLLLEFSNEREANICNACYKRNDSVTNRNLITNMVVKNLQLMQFVVQLILC
jgi:hypothetical protein